jgi:hypothetical protein
MSLQNGRAILFVDLGVKGEGRDDSAKRDTNSKTNANTHH